MNIIQAAVLHKLVKEPHGKAAIHERGDVLKLSDPVQKLVHDINDLYGDKANKGYGRFEPDEATYPAARVLREVFQQGSTPFLAGSQQLLRFLAARADQAPLAKGGYVLMAHITNAATANWFLVAIINNVDGSAVEDDSLEIVKTVHVDLENLRVAGRVNLTHWLGGDQEMRYVGFLKHRGDVADYFKYFLGCNELVKDTEETKGLVTALKSFARSESMTPEQEEEFFRTAYGYCRERNKNNEPVSLDALINAAWPTDPKKLQKALADSGVQISDGFVPDGRIIKKLVKLHARTKFWTIDMDRHAFVSGDAEYYKAKGELVLRNLPDDLKAELDSEMADGS
jgi:nucleoid-associated protein